jgi:ribosomal RNA-processing protein 8
MLNEKLYTCSGKEALDYFKEDPQMFDMYHTGYQQQMSNWPELPVNSIINWLLSNSSSLVVADFGCGENFLSCIAISYFLPAEIVSLYRH